jgi:peptidoglycan/LPS O-acetylase OafA/YrhL
MADDTIGARPPAQRNQAIDFLRGISILWVLLMHTHAYTAPLWPLFFSRCLRNVYYGVAIFFVVSGFLITQNALRRYGTLPQIDLSDFYVMRIARIIPALALLSVVLTGLHFLGIAGFTLPSDRNPWEPMQYAMTFRYHIYYTMHADLGDTPWRPLWSLAIEEWFYVAFPVMCIALRRTSLIAVLLGAAVVYSCWIRESHSELYQLDGNVGQLAIGCLTAVLVSRLRTENASRVAAVGCRLVGMLLIVSAAFAMPPDDFPHAGPLVVAIGAAVFIVGSTLHDGAAPRTAGIGRLGRLSYELYLFHLTVVALLPLAAPVGPQAAVTNLCAILFAALLWAAATSILYTEPLNRWIRQRLCDRSGQQPRQSVGSGLADTVAIRQQRPGAGRLITRA